LSKPYADTLYCSINGNCNISNLTYQNITYINYNVTGSITLNGTSLFDLFVTYPYLQNNYYNKTEVYNKTESDSLYCLVSSGCGSSGVSGSGWINNTLWTNTTLSVKAKEYCLITGECFNGTISVGGETDPLSYHTDSNINMSNRNITNVQCIKWQNGATECGV
jgi:hypothetical protein